MQGYDQIPTKLLLTHVRKLYRMQYVGMKNQIYLVKMQYIRWVVEYTSIVNLKYRYTASENKLTIKDL